jgi:uncharacterized protein (UPF0262 family)
VTLLNYAQLKARYDAARTAKDVEALRDSALFDAVEQNTFSTLED